MCNLIWDELVAERELKRESILAGCPTSSFFFKIIKTIKLISRQTGKLRNTPTGNLPAHLPGHKIPFTDKIKVSASRLMRCGLFHNTQLNSL